MPTSDIWSQPRGRGICDGSGISSKFNSSISRGSSNSISSINGDNSNCGIDNINDNDKDDDDANNNGYSNSKDSNHIDNTISSDGCNNDKNNKINSTNKSTDCDTVSNRQNHKDYEQ